MHPRLRHLLLFLLLVISASLISAQSNTLTGYFGIIHGDALDGSDYIQLYTLSADDGQRYQLNVAQAVLQSVGGAEALSGQRVSVAVASVARNGKTLNVANITPLAGPRVNHMGATSSGTAKWINLNCQFNNRATIYFSAADVGTMTGNTNTAPSLAHYWNTSSHGKLTTNFTTRGYRTLSNGTGYYDGLDTFTALDALFDDCIAAHDADVNFSNFDGINMFFNGDLQSGLGFGFGGFNYLTLDGVTKIYGYTWMPTSDQFPMSHSFIGHEMGHTMGLPHSNNNDGDSDTYDNPWDLMSDSYSYAPFDGIYGYLSKQTNLYHYDGLGWVNNANRLNFTQGDSTIILDQWSASNTSNYHMVKISIDSNNYWVIEAHKPGPLYQYGPKPGVIAYRVAGGRQQPAWLVGDSEQAWTPGQSFKLGDTSIQVLSETANGYQLRIFTQLDLGVIQRIAPLDYSSMSNLSTDFVWNPLADATEYKLIIKDTNKKFKFVQWLNASDICATTCVYNPQTAGNGAWTGIPYYKTKDAGFLKWKIVAKSPLGKGKTNGAWRLYTDKVLPPAIAQTAPAINATIGQKVTNFSWSADTRVAEYKLKLRHMGTGTTYSTDWLQRTSICNASTCTTPVNVGTIGGSKQFISGDYKWFVVARHPKVLKKAKSAKVPVTFQLTGKYLSGVTPANNATSSDSLDFVFNYAGHEQYRVVVIKPNGTKEKGVWTFAGSLYCTSTCTYNWTAPWHDPLSAGKTYRWFVQGRIDGVKGKAKSPKYTLNIAN